MSFTDILPWVNLLLVPTFVYIVKMEHRMTAVEITLEIFAERRKEERH